MKNYYDLLEVSSKASKEVIEKAYKVLIKKNHPDMHNPDLEKKYENYIKDINEAYAVLSNDFLREQYDKELISEKQKEYTNYNQNVNQKQAEASKKFTLKNITKKREEQEPQESGIIGICKLLFRKRDLSGLKNKDKEEVKKDLFAMGLTAIILIVVGLLLYFIPFTHNWMDKNFIQNPLIQGIINLFK